MPGKKNAPRDPGRPRQFSDEMIFIATAEAVAREGYRGLKLAAVANILGCTGPALIHRFGSRQGLLLGYLTWSIERSNHLFEATAAEFDSPLAALRARFSDPGHRHNRDDVAHSAHMVFFAEGRTDPEFVPHLRPYQAAILSGIERLLVAAIDRGELRSVPTAPLANTLLAAIIGANLMWSPVLETPLAEAVGGVIDAIIAPYRIG